MNRKKISEQVKNMLSVYTFIMVISCLIAVIYVSAYNRVIEIENSSQALVKIIASDLEDQYFTIKDGKVVVDKNYYDERDFLVDIMNSSPNIGTIYVYAPINNDEKRYLINIERNENGYAIDREDFINMEEEFTDELNPVEHACYLTGTVGELSDITLFTKYGSNITTIMPIYEYNHSMKAFVGIDYDISLFIYYLIRLMLVLVMIFVVIGLAVSNFGLQFVHKNVVMPIQKIEAAAVAFASSEHNGNSKQYHLLAEKNSENEVNNLALSMNTMMNDIDNYITNIASITAEKERICVELDVATKIQASYLPNCFPAFPEKTEFSIFASMDPAKEVGGDFYDFFIIDDDHFALVVADVSGKGVPAALFMMIGKTIIKNQAQNTQSPATIMHIANNQLCENNNEGMFITVWLGIVELSTGIVRACNAGHSAPYVQEPDGIFEHIKDKHGIMVGQIPNFKYKEYEFQLKPGSTIFNCTDGVMEATNNNEELFGMERLLSALNKNPYADVQTIIHNVRSSIDSFVGDAPQFDDITMLCFRYHGSQDHKN